MVPHWSHIGSHIKRKRGVFFYRRRLPRPHQDEITLSLGTTSFWLAQALAKDLDDAFLRFLQRPPMNEFDIKKALREYLRAELKSLRQKHLATPRDKAIHALEVDMPYDTHAVREADYNAIESRLRSLRRGLRERDLRGYGLVADDLSEGHVLTSEQRVEFALGLMKAQIQVLEQSERWIRHGLIDEIKFDEPASGTPSVERPPVEPENIATGPKLSEALPTFLDFMTKDQGWRGQTLAQNQATYRMFVECCGDRPVSQYERTDLTRFYDLLRGLPALYAKSKEWSALSLVEIIERTKGSDHPRLAMKTVKRHFSALGRLFAYLKRRGEYVRENPAHGFEFPSKGRARDKRKMWEGDKLRRLFSSPVWTGCRSETQRSKPGKLIIEDEKYWLPILGLFHGNRLEEFAQLVRSDVRCEEGIWFLDINDELTKQLKNDQSKRRVPLHPRVEQAGFLDYVETTAPNPRDRLFPKLRPGGADGKLGFSFTKWWTRYRKDIGVYEPGLDYHSFRGGVTTKLAAAHVSLDIRNELLGHEGSSVDERVYLKGLPLRTLAEAIARIEWPEFALAKTTARLDARHPAGNAEAV